VDASADIDQDWLVVMAEPAESDEDEDEDVLVVACVEAIVVGSAPIEPA
jgi:hypothetical protein